MVKLIKLFNIVAAIFPFILAFGMAGVSLTTGWEGLIPNHTHAYYGEPQFSGRALITALYIVYAIIIYLTIHWLQRVSLNPKRKSFVEFALIFVTSLVVRLIVIRPQTNIYAPFSDFNRVWEMAHGQIENHLPYYSLFPTYLNYTVLIKAILEFLGDSFSNIIIVNILLSASTSGLIYWMTKECTSIKWAPLLAGLIYSMMPSSILYCCIMTPEFVTIFFSCLAVFMILKALHADDLSKVILFLIAGISLGIASAYKPFSIIIIIATVMCVIVEWIIERQDVPGIVLVGIFSLFCLFCAHSFTKAVILHNTEITFGIDLDESTALPHFLTIGLNTEGEGQIHIGEKSRIYYQTYLSNGYDSENAKTVAFETLKDDWKSNLSYVPTFFFRKLIWTWQDDTIPLLYYDISRVFKDSNEAKLFGAHLGTIVQVYYFILMFLGAMGTLTVVHTKNLNIKIEHLLLVVFGFFCLMLLSEAQSRYKCLIMPFICVISAIGTEKVASVSDRIFRRLQKWSI